jgi:hypothetical protein
VFRRFLEPVINFREGGARHPWQRQKKSWRSAFLNSIAGCGQSIVNTGFTGYVVHEFVPTREPLSALAEAFTVCNV